MSLWEWIPIREAAGRLAVAERLINRRVDSGRIDCLTVDGVRFVWMADVVQDIRRQRLKIAELKNALQRRGFAVGCRSEATEKQ